MHEINLIKIIKKIKKGEVNYFEDIINMYDKKLYGYIYNLVKDKHLTEDLLQDTFIKIYKNIHKYDSNKCFSAWIITIARNTVFDYTKKKKICTLSLLDEKDIDVVDNENDPSDILEGRERLDCIENLVKNLPKKYRDVILLKYFDGLNYVEIAEKLGIATNTVKWQLYQARKLLIKEMNILKEKEGQIWNVK